MEDPYVRKLMQLLNRYRNLPSVVNETREIIDKIRSSLHRGQIYYEIHDRGTHVDVVIEAPGIDPQSVEVFPLDRTVLLVASGVGDSPDLAVVVRRSELRGVHGVSHLTYNNGVLTVRFYR